MKTASLNPLPLASPFSWLADRRFGVWLPRFFWLLLIIETFLWTNIGRLFTHGEIIAPVLFITSKATLIVASAHLLARFARRPAMQGQEARSALMVITSALFLLWFTESLLHAVSLLLVWLFNALAVTASNSWDLIGLVLRKTEPTAFEPPTAGYMLIANLAYGLAAIGLLRLLSQRWPPRLSRTDGAISLLPHWLVLLLAYCAIAVLHAALMRLWIS